MAVVDYVIVAHQELQKCDDFEVLRARHLFDNAELLGVCDPDHNIADHSVLFWSYILEETIVLDTEQSNSTVIKYKYDVSQIPDTFMSGSNLQYDPNIITADLNKSNADFCAVIKLEMETTLSKKRIDKTDDSSSIHNVCFLVVVLLYFFNHFYFLFFFSFFFIYV